jgi:hypothetical protein
MLCFAHRLGEDPVCVCSAGNLLLMASKMGRNVTVTRSCYIGSRKTKSTPSHPRLGYVYLPTPALFPAVICTVINVLRDIYASAHRCRNRC